jgi:dihydroorotate dehydrogenase
MTRKLARLRDDLGLNFSIIGVGGMGSSADYQQYREAGADAVMAATSAMWNPLLAREVKGHADGI